MLEAANYEEVRSSSIFRNFKYIKTFTPPYGRSRNAASAVNVALGFSLPSSKRTSTLSLYSRSSGSIIKLRLRTRSITASLTTLFLALLFLLSYYDGGEVDEAKTVELVDGFDTMDHYMRETWIKIFAEAKVSSKSGAELPEGVEEAVQKQLLENYIKTIHENRKKNAKVLMEGLHFVNKNGQPLRMMPKLELDPALLEQPLYH